MEFVLMSGLFRFVKPDTEVMLWPQCITRVRDDTHFYCNQYNHYEAARGETLRVEVVNRVLCGKYPHGYKCSADTVFAFDPATFFAEAISEARAA